MRDYWDNVAEEILPQRKSDAVQKVQINYLSRTKQGQNNAV